MEMPKSPHPCRMSMSINRQNLSAVMCQVFHTMPSPEKSQELVAAVAPPLQLDLPVPKSPSLISFCLCRLASSRARLILWVRPTLRAQVTSLTTVPTTNVLARIPIRIPVLTFFLAITFSFLALSCTLSYRHCQSCPPPLHLKCALRQLS